MKAKLLLIPVSLMLLAGCSEEHEDLQQWMADAKKAAQPKAKETFTTLPQATYNDPPPVVPNAFSIFRMRAAYQTGNAPNLNRSKELLEKYDLEQLKFVGAIGSGGSWSALIEVDGHVYTVKPGNHMGKNFGRISKITPDEITLVETVEDSYGNWVHKPAKLIPSADQDAAAAEEANN